MTKELKYYQKECVKLIDSIHGIDLSGLPIDEEQLEDAMKDGIDPIDVAIAFDPDNYMEDE